MKKNLFLLVAALPMLVACSTNEIGFQTKEEEKPFYADKVKWTRIDIGFNDIVKINDETKTVSVETEGVYWNVRTLLDFSDFFVIEYDVMKVEGDLSRSWGSKAERSEYLASHPNLITEETYSKPENSYYYAKVN